MEQIPRKKRSKPEKYLVLNVRELEYLIKMAHEDRDKSASNCVVIRLEHSGKRFPGQLSYTDEFQAQRLQVILGE